MPPQPRTKKDGKINTKKNIFEENQIFCEICKIWIRGILEIDSHFIIHSFKTWRVSSPNSSTVNPTEVLKQRTAQLLEFNSRVSDVSRINVFDARTGKQQQLLTTLFSSKGFSEKVNKYFEDKDSVHNNLEEDDSASVATVPRDQLSRDIPEVKNEIIKLENLDTTESLTDNHDAIADEQKEKGKTENPVVTNMGNKDTENEKCYKNKASTKRQNIVSTEDIVQHHNELSDFGRKYCSYSDNKKSSLVVPVDSIQNNAQNCHLRRKNGSNHEFPNAMSMTSMSTACESVRSIKKEKSFSTSKSVEGGIRKGEISPRYEKTKVKRTYDLETANEPLKKAKLEKLESPARKQNTDKNRKSNKSSNKLRNKSKWALDRYTIIQPQPVLKCDRDKSDLNISDTDSSVPSVRGDCKSKLNEKELRFKNSRNEAKDNEIKTPNKLYLKKSSSVMQTVRCKEKITLASEKSEKKKKIKKINKLEEYIRINSQSDSPLTSEQIQELRYIRQEIIAAPYKRKVSTKVEEAMASTYSLRYTELRVNAMTIKDALKIFPGLQNYSLLKLEFERCTHHSLDVLPRRLHKFFEEMILNEKRYLKLSDKYQMCKKAMQKLKLNESQSDTELQQNVGMILFGYKVTRGSWNGTLFHCRKKEEEVILEKPTPFIDIIKDDLWTPYKKMDVYVERIKIGRVPSFYDAVIMVYVIYWVFNLEYDDSLRPVFEYFDWIVGNPQNTYY